jgi:hypothetical protein
MSERINGVPVADGMFGTVDELDYHADRGSLSQSGAKILVSKGGPAKFRAYMDKPRKPKPEFDFGHATHSKVLGKGAELAVLDPAIHGKNKDGSPSKNPANTAGWQTAIREARAAGQIPISLADDRIAEQMAANVRSHPVAGPLFERGHAEVSFYGTDEETGVRMRGRCDWITLADLDGQGERPVIVDVKTTLEGGAEKVAFCRKAFDLGYHIQFPWYVRLYAEAMHSEPPVFLFVAVEKVEPYLVNVIELDLDAYRLGASKMREALRIYRDCTEAGIWPGYPEIIHTGSLPGYAFTSQEPTMSDLIDN